MDRCALNRIKRPFRAADGPFVICVYGADGGDRLARQILFQIRDDSAVVVGVEIAVVVDEFPVEIAGYEPGHCGILDGLCLCEMRICRAFATYHLHEAEHSLIL